MEAVANKSNVPAEWDIFIRTLSKKKKDVSSRLIKWGDPLSSTLIEKVDKCIKQMILSSFFTVSRYGSLALFEEGWVFPTIVFKGDGKKLRVGELWVGNCNDTIVVNSSKPIMTTSKIEERHVEIMS